MSYKLALGLAAKQEKFRQNVRTGKYGGKGGTKSGGKKRR